MEAALVSSSIKIIVPRLFSLASEKYKLSKSTKGNVEFLKHELEMIATTIDDQISRGEHLSLPRTQWIQELRRLAYEIEDCIDRYVYRLTYKQISSSMRRATMMLEDLQFAAEIRKLLEKVKEPSERIGRYTSNSQLSTMAEPPAPAYDPRTEKADLVGIDESQKELLELLEEGKGKHKQRKVISIVGFDGVGKTVLAEQVFDSDVAKQFSPRAWVDAAEKDAKDVLISIHSNLGLGNNPKGNVKVLSSDLEAHLKDKRYLIVIDDMRTELWSTIGPAFPANKGLSCSVIVTTPIQSIGYACSSDDRFVYKMRELGGKHSAELFEKKGPKVEFDQTEILKKCDGLPLALVSIAQFMSKKCVPNGTTTCKDLCNRLGYYLETDKDTLARMQRVLTKNYTSLQGHDLKACLLYLGMFPSEHPISRKRLISRWLAEGFVETHDLAVIKFEELMDRNIIRPVDVSHNEKVKTCRTCGMMVEFILRKSTLQDFITMFPNSKAKLFCDEGGEPTGARRLCLHRMSRSNGSLGDVSHVRSLTVFGEADQHLMVLKKCQLLRVLDLEECSDLKDISLKGISNFLLLKYLSLGETISLLPREIANLEFLQTLIMKRKKVTTLPVEVVLLPFLIHLLGKFRIAGKSKQMIRAEQFLLSGKSKLQTLAGFIVDDNQGFPQLMIHMNNLRKVKAWCESPSSSGIVHLSEAVQKFIQDDEEEEQANQDERSLSLHYDESASDFLHSLKGPCYLSSLKLRGNFGTVLPQFVSLLRGLRELCLSTSNLTRNILATTSKLCYLQYLKLNAEQLDEFVMEAGAFPKLLRLCLVLQRPINNILEIKEGALLKLVALQLLFEGLNGPYSGINIMHLNSLKEVTLHRDQTTKLEEWQRAARDHPNWPRVELHMADSVETDVTENSTEQDVKPTPEMAITQRQPQDQYRSSSRLKMPHENNDMLNCRSEEIKETCLDQECPLNSTDLSNVASDVDGSTKAKTHGRKFGGNQVVSVIYPEDKFAAEQYDG